MTSLTRLHLFASDFELGLPIKSFVHRLDVERSLFVVTDQLASRTLGLRLSGFNSKSLEKIRERVASTASNNHDLIIAFELRKRLQVLALSEPYRFSGERHTNEEDLKLFGRQLRKWVARQESSSGSRD